MAADYGSLTINFDSGVASVEYGDIASDDVDDPIITETGTTITVKTNTNTSYVLTVSFAETFKYDFDSVTFTDSAGIDEYPIQVDYSIISDSDFGLYYGYIKLTISDYEIQKGTLTITTKEVETTDTGGGGENNMKSLETKIVIRNDINDNWATKNPVLSKGEIGLITDLDYYKVGDGITSFSDLPTYEHFTGENSITTITLNGTDITDVETSTAEIVINDINFADGTSVNVVDESVELATVAKTGSYNDLSDTPTIVDNLTSTSTTSVLSANQGNVLKNMVQAIPTAKSYATISAMVTALNSASSTDFNVGANIFIQALDVPDFWIYSVASSQTTYTYSSDASLISAINSAGYVQIGYYQISKLETEKVDLTDYTTSSELETATTALQDSIDEITNDETIIRTTDILILNGGTSEDWS